MFGLRALIGDAFQRRGGCGGYSDASAALYSDCYESPRMQQSCRGGGCEPEGFCYSATPRSSPYYAQRGMFGGGYGGFGGFGGYGGFGGGIGGALLGLGLGRMFGGGGRGMFLGGMLGGLLGRFIGRLAFRGGGGGGFNDGGGCDNGGYDQGFDNDGFDNGDRYDRRDRERYDRQERERRYDQEREIENRNRNRQNDADRNNGRLDNVRGVSDAAKERAQSMTGFEQSALNMINDFRRSHGLSDVAFDPRLQLIAQVHSDYQNQNGLGHNENRQGWATPSQRMRQVGLNGWAENSGYGYFSSPQQLVQMWINSPGHRRALLDPNVKIAGISKIGKGATLDLV